MSASVDSIIELRPSAAKFKYSRIVRDLERTVIIYANVLHVELDLKYRYIHYARYGKINIVATCKNSNNIEDKIEDKDLYKLLIHLRRTIMRHYIPELENNPVECRYLSDNVCTISIDIHVKYIVDDDQNELPHKW